MADPQQPQQNLDFSDLGAKSVQAAPSAAPPAPAATGGGAIDFTDLGAKQVVPVPESGQPANNDQSVFNNDPVTGKKILDVGKGIAKGVGQTASTVMSMIPGVSDYMKPAIDDANKPGGALDVQGPDQKIGAGLEAAAEFMLGDEALKDLSLADKIPLIGKAMKSLEEAPSLLKNVLAHMAATGARQATVGGVQTLAHGGSAGEALENAAITGGVGAATEGLLKGVEGKIQSKAPVTKAATELTPQAKSIAETGKDVQASAEKVRADKGKEIGAAKAKVKESLPEGQIPFPKDGQAATTAKQVLEDIGSTKLGLKDPDMKEIGDLAKTLSEGTTEDGKPLTYSPEEADAERRSLSAKIDALRGKADQGGNATALRHLTRLKQGFDADYFDMLEKNGDPAAAQNLRTLNKQYAGIMQNQTDSPAAKLLNKQSPEQIVTNIISGGKNSQTAVEELVKNLDDSGKKALADSVLKEMHSKATLPGGPNKGNVNMQGVQAALEKMGDTAKAVFGKDLPTIQQYTDAASDYQAKLEADAAKPSKLRKAITSGARLVGAGAGAPGGPLVAMAGEHIAGEITDALFQQGRSGAVRVGISPTEQIVLSPAEFAAKRPLVTKFLKGKISDNTAAMAAAYNALAGKKNDDSPDRGSL